MVPLQQCQQIILVVFYWVDLKKAALHTNYADIVWLLKRTQKPGLADINVVIILTTIIKQFSEKHFELRNKATHQHQCSLVQADTTGTESKKYGINRNSILNDLAYFHVCDGSLLPDIMHDILEGTLQYEVKLMLQILIHTDKYFTLDQLNSWIENFELGYMESSNRPTTISAATINSGGNTLKQNGTYVHMTDVSIQ